MKSKPKPHQSPYYPARHEVGEQAIREAATRRETARLSKSERERLARITETENRRLGFVTRRVSKNVQSLLDAVYKGD